MKTFILGLGHQKCGTTWFYQYLKNQSNFNSGITKQYHIWDALDIECCCHNKIDHPENDKSSIKYKMQNEEIFYFEYFNSLLAEKINLTADIIPSYAGLTKKKIRIY